MDKTQKNWIAFGILFALTLICIGFNGGFETHFGNIKVSEITITTADGYSQVGKLYLPDGVDSDNPAPGVLAIHGYNNDKHVQRPHSLELAKRGIVVLAIDCIDHGDSDNWDLEAILAGNSVWSTYPLDAYAWLESQPYVTDQTGVVGHSMGAMWAHIVHLYNPQIDVVGYQAFGPDNFYSPTLSGITGYTATQTNFIQICSGMEEFGTRQWYQSPADWKAYCETWIKNNTVSCGIDDGTGEFFKTYGDISTGSAQRYVWIWKTHPGQTHDLTATKEITAFFLQTFGYSVTPDDINTTYIIAEILGAASALFLMLSIVPLVSLLLGTSSFSEVKQPMAEIKEELKTKKWVWWLFAVINFTIGGLLYMFGTNAPDAGILGIDSSSPWFFQNWMMDANNLAKWSTFDKTGFVLLDMGVANGYYAFYATNFMVNVIFVLAWYFIFGKKNGAKGDNLGIYTPRESFGKNAAIFGKTILLAGVVFLYMYGMCVFSENIFHMEIRGPWSMFKTFTPARAARFWLYLPPVLLFFIFNGGIWLFGLMRQPEYGGEFKTSFIWWIKVCFAMLTGLILLNIIDYFPLWIGVSGHIFQRPFMGNGFAPMYLLQTWLMIPAGAVMYWIGVKYYRETGRIWLGAIMLSVMTTWMFTTGTVVDPFVL